MNDPSLDPTAPPASTDSTAPPASTDSIAPPASTDSIAPTTLSQAMQQIGDALIAADKPLPGGAALQAIAEERFPALCGTP